MGKLAICFVSLLPQGHAAVSGSAVLSGYRVSCSRVLEYCVSISVVDLHSGARVATRLRAVRRCSAVRAGGRRIERKTLRKIVNSYCTPYSCTSTAGASCTLFRPTKQLQRERPHGGLYDRLEAGAVHVRSLQRRAAWYIFPLSHIQPPRPFGRLRWCDRRG